MLELQNFSKNDSRFYGQFDLLSLLVCIANINVLTKDFSSNEEKKALPKNIH